MMLWIFGMYITRTITGDTQIIAHTIPTIFCKSISMFLIPGSLVPSVTSAPSVNVT